MSFRPMKILLLSFLVFLTIQNSVFTRKTPLIKEDTEEIRTIYLEKRVQNVKYSKILELMDMKKKFVDITGYNFVKNFYYPLKIPSQPRHTEYIKTLLPFLEVDRIRKNIHHLSTKSGKKAAEWIHSQFVESSNNRTTSKVSFFEHPWLQPSVIARIEGSETPDEIVIVGAHEDSIGRNNGSTNAPGASDNASGVSLLLEIYRVLNHVNFKPKRTIEFHSYSAEEPGLRGSGHVAFTYRNQTKKVVGMLNTDELGYMGKNPCIGIVQDFVNPQLTRLLQQIIDIYVTRVKWRYLECGYPCSDHGSWNYFKYPSSGLTDSAPKSDNNPNTHSERDTIQTIVFQHVLDIIKSSLAFVVEMTL